MLIKIKLHRHDLDVSQIMSFPSSPVQVLCIATAQGGGRC